MTAEEARAARVAKFDPRNVKSAKDVLDEKQRAIEQANQAGEKRKRDFNDDGDIDRKREDDFPDDMMISDTEGVLREQPGEGLKRPRIVKVTLSTKSGDENPRKDSKADSVHVVGLRGPDALPQSTREARDERKRIRRAAGNERKQKRKQEREEKVNEALRKLEKDPEAVISRSIKALVEDKKSRATARQDRDGQKAENEKRRSEKMARKKLKQEDLERKGQADIMMQDLGKSEGLADPEPKQATSAVIVTTLDRSSPTDMSIPPSPIFDTTMEPSASSVSSTLTLNEEKITKRTSDLEEYQQPLLTDDGSERAHVGDIEIETETLTIPAKQKRDPEVLKRKLAETIAEMRKARKAVGSGSEPRSRQELLDQRARKELAIRERKREQKKQAREVDNTGLFGNNSSDQEPSHADEREAVQSLISKPLNNFQFGNVAFDNGEKLSTSNPDVLIQVNKRKGRSDPVTALQALTAKHQRLDAYDPKKRSEIEEKDLWLNAKKRAQGEKIHDDLSLVKRTVKRLEKGKEKSGKEWEDRKENVKKGIEMRQKKREENLRKRRDERVKQTSRSSRGGGGSKGSGPPKKRAGFEGSFTGRSRKK